MVNWPISSTPKELALYPSPIFSCSSVLCIIHSKTSGVLKNSSILTLFLQVANYTIYNLKFNRELEAADT